jgi:putative phosphoribosyl transferase
MHLFKDRSDAGRRLARDLTALEEENPLILALPRGGITVAAEVALGLHAPLEILAVRTVRSSGNTPGVVGAITEDGFYWLDHQTLDSIGIAPEKIHPVVVHEGHVVQSWVDQFRDGKPLGDLHDRTIILVDDGLETGVRAVVGARYLRTRGIGRLILAVPVGDPEQLKSIQSHFDQIVALYKPNEIQKVTSDC